MALATCNGGRERGEEERGRVAHLARFQLLLDRRVLVRVPASGGAEHELPTLSA